MIYHPRTYSYGVNRIALERVFWPPRRSLHGVSPVSSPMPSPSQTTLQACYTRGLNFGLNYISQVRRHLLERS